MCFISLQSRLHSAVLNRKVRNLLPGYIGTLVPECSGLESCTSISAPRRHENHASRTPTTRPFDFRVSVSAPYSKYGHMVCSPFLSCLLTSFFPFCRAIVFGDSLEQSSSTPRITSSITTSRSQIQSTDSEFSGSVVPEFQHSLIQPTFPPPFAIPSSFFKEVGKLGC